MARTDTPPAAPEPDEPGTTADAPASAVPASGATAVPAATAVDAPVVPTTPVRTLDDDGPYELDEVDELEDVDDLEDFADLEDDRALRSAPGLGARVGAELFGTFALVLVVVGTGLYSPLLQQPGALGVALAGGLVLTGLMAAFGLLSGGQFNPAVSLAAAVAGRLSWIDLALYWLAQIAGGVAGAAVVFATIPTKLPSAVGKKSALEIMEGVANGFGKHSPLSTFSQGAVAFDLRAAFLIELIAAGVLAAVYLGAGPRPGVRRFAPVAIGLTYAALLLLTAPFTGSSVNPARSAGVAVFAGSAALKQVWLFLVAPLLGGAIAGLVHRAASSGPDLDRTDGRGELTDEPVLRGY
jgi:aquaporin Z